jgi:hypothetical protein
MENVKLTKELIYITVKTEGKQQPERKEIHGYSFEYFGLKFNVHQSINTNKIWNVSEYQTGMIVRSGKTKKEALNNFEAIINKLGEEKFLYFVNKNLNTAKEKGII